MYELVFSSLQSLKKKKKKIKEDAHVMSSVSDRKIVVKVVFLPYGAVAWYLCRLQPLMVIGHSSHTHVQTPSKCHPRSHIVFSKTNSYAHTGCTLFMCAAQKFLFWHFPCCLFVCLLPWNYLFINSQQHAILVYLIPIRRLKSASGDSLSGCDSLSLARQTVTWRPRSLLFLKAVSDDRGS